MSECVFCEIVRGKNHSAVIDESESVIVVMDRYPLVEGHVLAIPKKHYESLFEMPPADRHSLFDEVARAQQALMKSVDCDGIDLRQHYRPFLPETKLKVNHVHIHIMPRRLDDELYRKSLKHQEALRREPTLDELRSFAKRVAQNIKPR